MLDQVISRSFLLEGNVPLQPFPKGGISVTSNADFLLHLMASNCGNVLSVVSVVHLLPPAGIKDDLSLNFLVPGSQAGAQYLGCVGLNGNETMLIRHTFGSDSDPIPSDIRLIITMITTKGASFKIERVQ